MVDHQWRRNLLIFVASFCVLFVHTLEQQFLVSWQERLALIQLRSSLGLRSKEWPIKSNPCISWTGIECTNGRVTGINVSGLKRTRRGNQNPQFSVDALQNLTLLSSFNASNFALPGSIPDWFGLQLPSLQVLDLRSCLINGAIPSTLGNLSNAVELYLSGNNLTSVVPPTLGRLFRLSVLDLSRNLLTGSIPATFGDLGNLTLLDMSSNFLSGGIPPSIGSLSRLQFLNLSGNSLSSSIPAQLGNLSRLVELDLGFNSLSGSVPVDLGGLRSLRLLILENNYLSGSFSGNLFSSLTQLQSLLLSHNGLSGELPEALWSIPSLQILDVSVNNFTGLLPNVSSTTVASLLNISWNLLYGRLTPVIGRFNLSDLSGNYFEGPVPPYAGGNASLISNCLQNVADQRAATDCASFYADRSLSFDNFGKPNTTQPTASPKSKNNSHKKVILASVFGGVGLLGSVVLIVLLLIVCKRKRVTADQRSTGVGPVRAGGSSPLPGVVLDFSTLGDAFTYQQILEAANGFDDAYLIKRGHSGDLFSGKLEGGIPVVIKKIDLQSSPKNETYVSELELFSKVSNPRLVPLLGHCLENENDKFLVYKRMPNGDLSSSLFKKRNGDDDSLQSLDWITRLKVAIGTAEGLSYLHHECSPPLVHRDIQASSILLDDKYEVRLGSLSEVCVQEADSHQNRITRLIRLPQASDQSASGTPNATCAYDVYCFGKVLLELVTGKLGFSSSTDAASKEWLEATLACISIYDKELVTNIVDPSLIIDEDLLEEVWAMAIVARSCLNPKPTRRPLMRYILKALENPLKVVREENTRSSSARLRTTSSRGSWNAAAFGSWRHTNSDVGAAPAAAAVSRRIERGNSSKQSGSQGSGRVGGDGNSSFSNRRHSKEIFPEPLDVERRQASSVVVVG